MFDSFVIIVENISIYLLYSEFPQNFNAEIVIFSYNQWEILLKLLIYFVQIFSDDC
jgi:hypothetical protein